MSLDPDYYRNLLDTLSEQEKRASTHRVGWANSGKLTELMKNLYEEASARHVFIIESNGKKSASFGDLGQIDTTDLISLVVGKILACKAIAELFGGGRFLTASIEGRRWGAHFSLLNANTILMVVFDHQTNSDRVGNRVRRATAALATAIDEING